jgi:hypothetical protein
VPVATAVETQKIMDRMINKTLKDVGRVDVVVGE